MNFNLIPWDGESYLVAADYAEEQGNLLPNAIRDKVLPLDIESCYFCNIGKGYGISHGWASGFGDGRGKGVGGGSGEGESGPYGFGWGWGAGEIYANGLVIIEVGDCDGRGESRP